MHSLDFEEFCWANGLNQEGLTYVQGYFEKETTVPKPLHDRMLSLLKEYIIIGGMPRVVQDFVDHHDFNAVLKIQRGIIDNYLDDIAKYASGVEKAKARNCFLSIPRQLAKANKKFQYSIVEKNGSARKFAGALMWLLDAGIISFCHNLAIPELPLEGNSKQGEFKVYMRDTGLLMAC